MINKKVRIELQYDPVKDKDILEFIDKHGSTRAGFIKFALRHYMDSLKGVSKENQIEPKKNTKRKKKEIPKLGQSFSSNDLE